MGDTSVPMSLDGLLEPLSRCLDRESAKRVIEFQIDAAVQARAAMLAGKANEGTLDDDERSEYEAFVDAVELISILQLKAQRQLERNAG